MEMRESIATPRERRRNIRTFTDREAHPNWDTFWEIKEPEIHLWHIRNLTMARNRMKEGKTHRRCSAQFINVINSAHFYRGNYGLKSGTVYFIPRKNWSYMLRESRENVGLKSGTVHFFPRYFRVTCYRKYGKIRRRYRRCVLQFKWALMRFIGVTLLFRSLVTIRLGKSARSSYDD